MKFNAKFKTLALSTALAGILAAAPIAAHAQLGNETLHKGMWSPDVKALQNDLHQQGYLKASATGFYGKQTTDAVKAYQKAHDLSTDGVAGPKTFAALNVKSLNIQEKPLLFTKGDHNRSVKQLQKQLEGLNYLNADPKGTYGSKTVDAVRSFQKSHDLKVDGMAGKHTLSALQKAVSKAKSQGWYNKPVLKKGDNGAAVKKVQSKLKDLGFYGSSVDGHFGSVTEYAVKIFQKDNNINVSGTVGKDTYIALNNHPVSAAAAAKPSVVESASTGPNKDNSTSSSDSANKSASANASAKSDSGSSQTTASSNSGNQNYRTITVKSTAYTASCPGCSGVTATGINLDQNPNEKVIAVDPSVIPLGSKVYVPGYGYAIAGDTGGAINGNRIDVYFHSRSEALNWGVKTIQIRVYQ